jgi:tripartite-type tricarboxylate transporter receptor subunit TctC
MFATTSVAVPQVKAGKLRALAVTSPTRLAALPDVPTLAEGGITGFDMKEWEGIVAPAGTPPEIVSHWSRELGRIMAQPELRERLAALGMVPAAPNSPDEFGTLVRNELQTWTRFVKASGIKAD